MFKFWGCECEDEVYMEKRGERRDEREKEGETKKQKDLYYIAFYELLMMIPSSFVYNKIKYIFHFSFIIGNMIV